MTSMTSQLDPDEFDATEWLSGKRADDLRPRKTVSVYIIDPALRDRMDALKEEHTKYAAALADQKKHKSRSGGELSIAQAGTAQTERRVAELERQMEHLLEELEEYKRTITFIGLIRPEIDKILEGIPESDAYGQTVALLAASSRVNGKRMSVQSLAKLHPAIGEAQWQTLVQAFNEATHGDPWAGVDVPF